MSLATANLPSCTLKLTRQNNIVFLFVLQSATGNVSYMHPRTPLFDTVLSFEE